MDVEDVLTKAVIRKQKRQLFLMKDKQDKGAAENTTTSDDDDIDDVNNATTLNSTTDTSKKDSCDAYKWPVFYLDTKKLRSAKVVWLEKKVQELKQKIARMSEPEEDDDRLFLKDLLKRVKDIPEHSKHSFRMRVQQLVEEFTCDTKEALSIDQQMSIQSTEYTVVFNSLD